MSGPVYDPTRSRISNRASRHIHSVEKIKWSPGKKYGLGINEFRDHGAAVNAVRVTAWHFAIFEGLETQWNEWWDTYRSNCPGDSLSSVQFNVGSWLRRFE
jgi:hypothetical protein